MKESRMIQVLTDKKGKILGGGILNSAQDREGKPVHVQISPVKGRTLSQVPMPSEVQALEGAEMFRKLQSDFHLPRGKKELVRKAKRR